MTESESNTARRGPRPYKWQPSDEDFRAIEAFRERHSRHVQYDVTTDQAVQALVRRGLTAEDIEGEQ